jgi:expansin (peptidoglycan-binding protein)
MAPNLLYGSQALEKAQTGTEWLALAQDFQNRVSHRRFGSNPLTMKMTKVQGDEL